MAKKLIFQTVHGSHLYGFAHEGSDYDVYQVYEGSGTQLTHSIIDGVDTVRGSLEAFVRRATSGSHQSLEALFSNKKEWTTGMLGKWGPYLANFKVTGPEVFDKYERTIRKFCYGDFKRRRHAVRLAFNLEELRMFGRFNPTLDETKVIAAGQYAKDLEGDELRKFLHV